MKLAFYFVFVFLFAGCQSFDQKVIETKENTTQFSGLAMTIEYHIIVGQKLNEKEKSKVQACIDSVFDEIDSIYNKWNPSSELSLLNNLPAGKRYLMSVQLEQILKETQSIVELTEGRFDPTIEPIQDLWKQKLERGEVPLQSEIDKIAPAIGWNHIHFSDRIFYKDHDQTRLDLGGIAKGYGVDILVQTLNRLNFPNIFVEWGGEIRTTGQHPDRRLWNIFISHFGDANPQNALAYLSLHDEAIATSGDYLQRWEVGEQTYFHVFDPKSLKPLIATHSSVASASVLAPRCALADGLATAALMFSNVEEATAWAKKIQEKIPGTTFWLFSKDPHPTLTVEL